jgi:hypothetical protein
MTTETIKILILIVILGTLETAIHFPELREARRKIAASRIVKWSGHPNGR